MKVGRSQNITRRIATHLAAAAIHGATADCIWISEPVDRLAERERDLLAFCGTRWKLTAGGEYFQRADMQQIVRQANETGIATREVQGRPLGLSDNEGTSYTAAFQGQPATAADLRLWVARRVPHPDAPLIAHELFIAVLASGTDVIEMTLSTAGRRLRITATGQAQLSLRHSHGPGWQIVAGLARINGVTPDECGLWALLGDDE
ncbi:hypothetical protein [Streptomyces sp. NPDC051016]|uniref:hypothetical protein n=1 Tax=Streptomyces sp. NPDC051016 TaxID=3365638 RepID=UPI00379E00FA